MYCRIAFLSPESHLAGIAEQVANGELPDASLEFCANPLLVEGGSGEKLHNEDAVKTEKTRKKKVTSKVRSRLPKKALVDQGTPHVIFTATLAVTADWLCVCVEPESDSELVPSKNLSGDDFFLDVTGSNDPIS